MRGRRGRADRTFVVELSVEQLGLLVDVLTDFVRLAEQDATNYAAENDWFVDYQLIRSRKIIDIRHVLHMADPKEVEVGNSDEEQ